MLTARNCERDSESESVFLYSTVSSPRVVKADLFNLTPYRLLWEAFSHAEINGTTAGNLCTLFKFHDLLTYLYKQIRDFKNNFDK